MNLNKAFILGNLTRDPELRKTPSGQAVCTFSIATNSFYTDAGGQRQQKVEFHSIVAWGRNAEIISQYVHKGNMILVEGRLQTRNWQDTQNVKHYRTEVVAERIQLGPRGGSSGAGPQSQNGTDNNYSRNNNATEVHGSAQGSAPHKNAPEEPMPIIDIHEEGEEIDVKDIPF